jgi:3-hydroxybutyrate dehydrogenase
VLADVDEEGVRRAAEEVGGEPWVLDLSDPDSLAELSLDCDILVNNAGIQKVEPIESFDPAMLRRMMAIMLESPFLLIRAALPHMYAKQWGRVVNLSSVHGLRASPFKSAYVAAKHGLEGLSKTTALEGAPHGVTSNCINPSYVWSAIVQNQVADQAKVHGVSEQEVLEKVFLKEIPIKQLLEADEVASLATWLVGEDARMVTGASYTMDGGWTAR